MKTTQEMIEVMQAFCDGKQIQFLSNRSGVWVQTENPCWAWAVFDYRIKPEPKEIWVDDVKYREVIDE